MTVQNEKYIGDALLQKTYTVSILEKKRAANNGEMPKYYVEGSHEAIIDRDVFMKVKAEIARRANLNPDGKRRVYSSTFRHGVLRTLRRHLPPGEMEQPRLQIHGLAMRQQSSQGKDGL